MLLSVTVRPARLTIAPFESYTSSLFVLFVSFVVVLISLDLYRRGE